MGIELTIIDHHTLYTGQIKKASDNGTKIDIPKASSKARYISLVKEHLRKGYDLALTDSCPDGIASGVIYHLGTGNSEIYSLPNHLTSEQIEHLKKDGVKRLLVLDKQPVNNGDMKLFDKVTVLNHTFHGMSPRLNVSEIIYRCGGGKNKQARDLNAIGIVYDYGLKEGLATIKEVLTEYKDLFPEHSEKLANGTLNQHNILNSKFKDLVEMIQAPYIIGGSESVDNLIQTIIQNSPFTIADLLNAKSRKKAVSQIRKSWNELSSLTEKEIAGFKEAKKTQGKLMIYQPGFLTEGFIKILSKKLSETYPKNVVALKWPAEKGFAYMIRNRTVKASLSKVLKQMGVDYGGGLDKVVTCFAKDSTTFEEELGTRLSQ